MPATGYLHGYSPAEQRRLHAQARVMAPFVHRDLHFPVMRRGTDPTKVLEIGCGVGAQTALLLHNHPRIHITAIDRSATQLAAAQRFFRRHPHRRRVTFLSADAAHLPFPNNAFHGAFICWLLEHVPDSLPILTEAHRVLKPGGRLYLREVFNHTLYLYPPCPAHEKYWHTYNQHQTDLGGHPDIGLPLLNYLRDAGFHRIALAPATILFDYRQPALRRTWINYWRDLMMSGAPSLLKNRRVSPSLVSRVKNELNALRSNPDAIFYYTPVFVCATK